MTKTARVISIIFIISIFFVHATTVSAGFGDLVQPIPEDSQLPISDRPSVTFGDLLNNNSSISAIDDLTITTDGAQVSAKTAEFKKLLADLEKSYQISLTDFEAKKSQLPVNDLSVSTTYELSPTPFIPIHTLIAGVNEIISNQQLQNGIFPTPTLTDTLLLSSLNNSPQTRSARWQAGAEAQAMTPPMVKVSVQPATNTLGALTQNPVKTTYTVALLGDSMTDTLGKSLPHLRNLLQNAYPDYTFALLNYGQGATDLESGLYRLTNSTNYLGTDYPPLLSYKPDILVVESFAYNHWSGEKYDLDRQWLDIAKIIDTVRQNSPDTKIILAASIAPNKDIFGDGVLNWPANLKENASLIIKAYLQNMVNFATSQHYPLADAYHPSLESDGQGIAGYISSYDHLHPSGDGAYQYSSKILEAIQSNNLLP